MKKPKPSLQKLLLAASAAMAKGADDDVILAVHPNRRIDAWALFGAGEFAIRIDQKTGGLVFFKP